MTRLRVALVVGLGASAVLLAAVAGWRSLGAGRDRLRERESFAQATAEEVAEALDLRGRRERASLLERPKHRLIEGVEATLAAIAARDVRFDEVRSEGDAPIGRALSNPGGAFGFRAQSMRLTLRGMTLDGLGRFLARWRETQSAWTPTALEITFVAPRGQRPNERQEPAVERFDAAMVLVSVYVARPDADERNGGGR